MTVEKNGVTYRLCGYSNCFREAIALRGFMPICLVHKAEPRKWGKDGKTFTGTAFARQTGAAVLREPCVYMPDIAQMAGDCARCGRTEEQHKAAKGGGA